MLVDIMSSVTMWFSQVGNIIGRELSHMSPREYSIGLVLCICVGFVLLRGRN